MRTAEPNPKPQPPPPHHPTQWGRFPICPRDFTPATPNRPQIQHNVAHGLVPVLGIFLNAPLDQTLQSAAGVTGWRALIGTGSPPKTAAIKLARVFPSKQRLPVTISYTTHPNAKISLRASASMPSYCSGAMYCGVPRMVPSLVSASGIRVTSSGPTTRGAVFASPKSSTFTPSRVSMMLAGLTSR
jgi:hypothetical protein